MLTDEEIKKLWLDPKSDLAFSGIRNVKMLLKTTYGEVSTLYNKFLWHYIVNFTQFYY